MALNLARPGDRYDQNDEAQTRAAIVAEDKQIVGRLTALETATSTGGAVFTYAYNASDTANSLLHSVPTTGHVYAVGYGDSTAQAGSSANWQALDTTAYPPAGTFGYSSDATYGHIRDGVYSKFALIPDAGGRIDVRAALVKCDATDTGSPLYQCNGGTTGQQALLHSLRDWAIAKNLTLTGGGAYRIEASAGLDMKNANLEWGAMKLICSTGFTGFMLSIGSNFHNTEAWTANVFLWGDNGAFASSSTAQGVKVYDSQGALCKVNARLAYLNGDTTGGAFDLNGNTEDLLAEVHGEYCGFLVTVTEAGGGSPDDNRVIINGHNCKHWLYMIDGADCSIDAVFNVQNRTTSGDSIAAIQPSTGKNLRLSGFIRGHNGPEDCIKLSKDHGVSGVHFADLTIEHGYGTALNLEWVQRVSGLVSIRDFANAASGPSGGTSVTTVIYGRISNGGGLSVVVLGTANADYPVRVGESTGTYYPIDAVLPRTIVQKGNPEPYAGTYPSGTALYLFQGQNFQLDVDEIDGNIVTAAGVLSSNISVPAAWVRSRGGYSMTVAHTAPNLQMMVKGGLNSSEIFGKTWLFDGVQVETLSDYYGGGMYDGSRWRLT